MSKLMVVVSLFALAGTGTLAWAGSAPQPDVDPRVEIARKLGAKPEDIRPSQIEGIYEYSQGTDIGYVTADGRYFFGGDLFEIDTRRNLTDARRSAARQRLLEAVPESEMIVFSPATPKYTITVFTDIDCGYCRKLHSQIGELNNMGVRVRYMFYPRNGPGTAGWKAAESVWCSKNRNDALTRAKKGELIQSEKCGATPVARQYKLGEELGMHGTPGIFTAKGTYITGYLPPAKLLQELMAESP